MAIENTNLSTTKGKLRELEVEPYNMAAATLKNEEAEFKPSKISEVIKKVKESVIDTSDAIIKNVTGIEIIHNEDKDSQEQLTNIAIVPIDNKLKNKDQVDSITNKSPFKNNNYNDNNVDDVSNKANNKVSTIKIEEDPKMTAEKWEAELERVKREKKWEAELNRIKQEKKAAADAPKPQLIVSDNNNNKIIPQKKQSQTVDVEVVDENIDDNSNNNIYITTAPVVDNAACSVCVIA